MKKVKSGFALVLALMLVFAISTQAMAISKWYVDKEGELRDGETVSGSFNLTGWFRTGNNFIVAVGAGASKMGGELSFSLESANYSIPCNGKGTLVTSETGWSSGPVRWRLYNNTGKTIYYAIRIYKP